jgi:hypothetical protein
MSKIELREKIFLLIDQHSENERWLSRLYGLLVEMEIETEDVGDWWDELTPEEQAGLDEADRQLDAGESYTNEEVMAKVKEWIND